MRRIIFIILAGILVTTVTAWIFQGKFRGTAPVPPGTPVPGSGAITVGTAEGNRAPDFTLHNLEGQSINLAQLRGKIVVLNFWTTWCPSCREEMPDLERFFQTARAQGVVLLGINIREDRGKVTGFMTGRGYHYPVLLDSFGYVAESFRVTAIPTTYILDRAGVIRFKRTGTVTAPELLLLVQQITP